MSRYTGILYMMYHPYENIHHHSNKEKSHHMDLALVEITRKYKMCIQKEQTTYDTLYQSYSKGS